MIDNYKIIAQKQIKLTMYRKWIFHCNLNVLYKIVLLQKIENCYNHQTIKFKEFIDEVKYFKT